MSVERERTYKQNLNNGVDSFALQINRKDQIKILKKKQSMLKDAIVDERRKKAKLTEDLTAIEDKLKKYEVENKKKEEKNEALIAEIKSLKDALIVERNHKQKCMDQLESKLGSQSGKQQTSKSKLDSNRYFGLRALFQNITLIHASRRRCSMQIEAIYEGKNNAENQFIYSQNQLVFQLVWKLFFAKISSLQYEYDLSFGPNFDYWLFMISLNRFKFSNKDDGLIFLKLQSVQFSSESMSEDSILLGLFQNASETSRQFLSQLINDSFRKLGRSRSFELLAEWKTLSSALNTANKISCLRDRNHRSLILEFLKAEATSFYKGSYFNHAKIDKEYLIYLEQIGPYEFTEILTIVNKLKLIEKHHRLRMEANIVSENHIEEKIRKIMEICNSEKRTVNNNLTKFKAIVEFEDRIELIKELGKLLRQSWSSEKKNGKIQTVMIQPPMQTGLETTPMDLVCENAKFYSFEQGTGAQSFFDDQFGFL